MKLVILDYYEGSVDFLDIDKETEEYIDNIDDVSEFIEKLGYNINTVSWMYNDSNRLFINNYSVSMKDNAPVLND